MVERGELWWADFGNPRGSAPAFARPAVIVSSNILNYSRLRTVLVVPVTSNARSGRMPGNVALPTGVAGLTRDSVAVPSQVTSIDRADLESYMGLLPDDLMVLIGKGLGLALSS